VVGNNGWFGKRMVLFVEEMWYNGVQ